MTFAEDDDVITGEYDRDDWDDDPIGDDDYEGRQEPDCYGCCDTGYRPVSLLRYIVTDGQPFTRVRVGRQHCRYCNPSPRQRRRWPKYVRRLEQQGERHQRQVDAARARGELVDDESPF